MLADTLVLPYALRVHEDRDQADVQQMLQSAAHRQMALMLAARWHIGTFQRRSAEWHRGLGIAAVIGGNGSSSDHDWPAWFERVKTANGVVVQPLCSSGALRGGGTDASLRRRICERMHDRTHADIFAAHGKRQATFDIAGCCQANSSRHVPIHGTAKPCRFQWSATRRGRYGGRTTAQGTEPGRVAAQSGRRRSGGLPQT